MDEWWICGLRRPFLRDMSGTKTRPSSPTPKVLAFQAQLQSGLEEIQKQLPALKDALSEVPVLIGVSGGRDSVALLHGLVEAGWQHLVVCHLNHQLRDREADEDARFVRQLARQLKVKCVVRSKDVRERAKERGESLEAAGREERLAFFAETARRLKAAGVFTAHHADDQAETLLAAMLRGAGLNGMSGMKGVTTLANGVTLLRPLLNVRREEIEAYITARELSFREDASNASSEFQRNRIRHELLPLMREISGRDVVPPLQRLAAQALRDEQCLSEQVGEWMSRHTPIQADGSLKISVEMKALSSALLSRVLRHWLREYLQLRGIDAREVELAMQMLLPGGPAKINLPGGHHLRRKSGRLWVERDLQPNKKRRTR